MNDGRCIDKRMADHGTWSSVIGLTFFVPYLLVSLVALISLKLSSAGNRSRRKQHLMGVYALVTGVVICRTVDFAFFGFFIQLYRSWIPTMIHLLPSLILVSLFSYVCFVFYDMYAYLRYQGAERRKKVEKTKKRYLVINLVAYLLFFAVLGLIQLTLNGGLKRRETKSFVYTRLVVSFCWLYNCISVTAVGLKLYGRMKRVALIGGFNIDLTKLKRIVALIFFVTFVKVLLQLGKAYYEANENAERTLDLWLLHSFPNIIINGTDVNVAVLGYYLIHPLLLELLPIFFIVRALSPSSERSGGGNDSRFLVEKFIATAEPRLSARASFADDDVHSVIVAPQLARHMSQP
eukprot:TRINITY_DN9248_c0_g2_i2.p1 TRINITY_DN9248_c0_g2~~TRINITY_DN9248_c0_g2_i2.p1  ORF type:complete len:349 (+),score=63.36 TRINITY_DN9248_c0_g2_i2:136-1182(+)